MSNTLGWIIVAFVLYLLGMVAVGVATQRRTAVQKIIFWEAEVLEALCGGAFRTGIGYERMASDGASGRRICAGNRTVVDRDRSFPRNGCKLAGYFRTASPLYDPGEQFPDTAYLL